MARYATCARCYWQGSVGIEPSGLAGPPSRSRITLGIVTGLLPTSRSRAKGTSLALSEAWMSWKG